MSFAIPEWSWWQQQFALERLQQAITEYEDWEKAGVATCTKNASASSRLEAERKMVRPNGMLRQNCRMPRHRGQSDNRKPARPCS